MTCVTSRNMPHKQTSHGLRYGEHGGHSPPLVVPLLKQSRKDALTYLVCELSQCLAKRKRLSRNQTGDQKIVSLLLIAVTVLRKKKLAQSGVHKFSDYLVATSKCQVPEEQHTALSGVTFVPHV
jgi:hypothetical protein